MEINEFIRTGESEGWLRETSNVHSVPVNGRNQDQRVYEVRVDRLHYNVQNGRIATFISRYQMEQGKLPEDPEERDDLIEGMVGRDNPARLRTTKLDIKAKGQQEIAIIALLRGRPGRSLCAYGVPLSALVPARDVRRLGEVRAGGPCVAGARLGRPAPERLLCH